jgi:hypothetical protein
MPENLKHGLRSLGYTFLYFTIWIGPHHAYGTTAADFDAATMKPKQDQVDAVISIRDARDAMRADMTNAEWTAVIKDDNEKK